MDCASAVGSPCADSDFAFGWLLVSASLQSNDCISLCEHIFVIRHAHHRALAIMGDEAAAFISTGSPIQQFAEETVTNFMAFNRHNDRACYAAGVLTLVVSASVADHGKGQYRLIDYFLVLNNKEPKLHVFSDSNDGKHAMAKVIADRVRTPPGITAAHE